MRDDAPSGTAAWVAAMRGLATCLPPEICVARDPYGLRFGGATRIFEGRERILRATWRIWMYAALASNVHLLQLRTRAIDDAVRAFVAGGGRQVVILGAGFDCRAWRLEELRGVDVFEVDHPATQQKKRALIDGDALARVRYLAWNFEVDDLALLPARLRDIGHGASAPTLTLLEGVLPYLTADAIDRTFACVRAYSASRSPLVFTYFERSLVATKATEHTLVSMLGEPYRHGFEPSELASFLGARGFALDRDIPMAELARELLPPRELARLRRVGRHVALAIRC
jgi:methyltransferase (TIGR00027 family)